MPLRRLIIATATTMAVIVPLSMIPASSASASTGVLCNVHTPTGNWPCMQINGHGNTVYNITMWGHMVPGYPIYLDGPPISEHLELTGPGGVFEMNSPSFNLAPGIGGELGRRRSIRVLQAGTRSRR